MEPESQSPLHVEDVEGWAKLPRSVSDALTADELDFNSHGVLTFLIGAINWKTGVYRGTLRRLAEDIGWKRTSDYLRKTLNGLREDGWIGYESKSGKRDAYVIWLGARALSGQGNSPISDSTPEFDPPLNSEVGSDSLSSRNRANADARSKLAPSEPQTRPPLQEVEAEEEVDRQADGEREGSPESVGRETEAERWLKDEVRRYDLAPLGPGWATVDSSDNDIPF
jgi:hypothetical protein